MIQKLLNWLIFSVAMALLPIVFTALSLRTRGNAVDFATLVSHGELLIVAAALSARGVGEILLARSPNSLTRTIVGGAALVILGLASLYFADVAAGHRSGDRLQIDVIRDTSLWLFGFSVATGGSCIALREASDARQ